MAAPRYNLGSLYKWRFAADADIDWMQACMDTDTVKPGINRIDSTSVVRQTEAFIWTYFETNFTMENEVDFTNLKNKHFERNSVIAMENYRNTHPGMTIGMIFSDAVTGEDIGWYSLRFSFFDLEQCQRWGAPQYVLNKWVARMGVFAVHPSMRGGQHRPVLLCQVLNDYLGNADSKLPYRIHSVMYQKDSYNIKYHGQYENGSHNRWDSNLKTFFQNSPADIPEYEHQVDRIKRNVAADVRYPNGDKFSDFYWVPVEKNASIMRSAPEVIDEDGEEHRIQFAAEVLLTAEFKENKRNELINLDPSDVRYANKDALLETYGWVPDWRQVTKDENGLIYFPLDGEKKSLKGIVKNWSVSGSTSDSDWMNQYFY